MAPFEIGCFDIPTSTGFHCPGGDYGCFGNTDCAQCNIYPYPSSVNHLHTCTVANLSKSCHNTYPSSCEWTFAPSASPITPAPIKAPTPTPHCNSSMPNLSKPYRTVREFEIINKCEYPLWVGITGKSWTTPVTYPKGKIPRDGGFKIESKETINLNVSIMQSMLIWGRTNCGGTGLAFTCDTGSCTNSVLGEDGKCCATTSGRYTCGSPLSPTSLVEITLAKTECTVPMTFMIYH